MRVDTHRGSVEFDGRQVTITKKRRGSAVVPLSRLSGVIIDKAGLGVRAIRFSVAGGSHTVPSNAMAPKIGADVARALADPYALTFRKKHLPEFEKFRDAVLAATT